jgi:hypothetical protein
MRGLATLGVGVHGERRWRKEAVLEWLEARRQAEGPGARQCVLTYNLWVVD